MQFESVQILAIHEPQHCWLRKRLGLPRLYLSDTITSPRHQMHHPFKLDKSHVAKHGLNTAFRTDLQVHHPVIEGGKSYVVVSSFKCEAM